MSIFRRATVRVAVVQSRIAQGETEANWGGGMALLDQALECDPQLVVLPEAFSTGVNFIILRQMAEPVPDGPTCERLRHVARTHGIHLVAGVLENDGGRIYDSAIVVEPGGQVLARYRRRFLWVGERNYVSAGHEPVVVDTEIGRIAVIVGYDLCFPQASASFLQRDVDVIACPASVFSRLNFSARQLALARAADSHCYLAYANAVGFHQFANMEYSGGSGVFGDPYFLQVARDEPPTDDLGRLAMAGGGEEWLSADLHLEELRAARVPSRLPFKGDESYPTISIDRELPAVAS